MTTLEQALVGIIIVLVGLNVLSLVWWGGTLRAQRLALKNWQESEEEWCEIFSDFILTEMSDEEIGAEMGDDPYEEIPEMVSEESYEAETA